MEEQIVQLIPLTSAAGVAGLLVWRVLIPWSDSLLNKRKKVSPGLEGRVKDIEKNHMHDLEWLMSEFPKFQKEMREDFEKVHTRINTVSKDVAFVEGKLNGKR